MGLTVDPEVRTSLSVDPVRARVFVAGCVERLAQLFTGTRASEPGRQDDVAAYVSILDALWRADATTEEFTRDLATVEDFPELNSEDEVIESIEIAAFFAALALRHALRFRVTGDVEDAFRCGHACSTFAGLTDRNVPGLAWSEDENGYQIRDATDTSDPQGRRSSYQQVSRDRLLVVLRDEP